MKKKAILLMLVIMFISTNALSQNWIQGQITGDIQTSINVELYKTGCGDDELVDTYTTNSAGYYGFGSLDNGNYRVVPDNVSYLFNPGFYNIQIPQLDLQSYAFTSTYNCESGNRFFDMGDGTVLDCRTKKLWLKNANCYGGQYWYAAMDNASDLNSGECGLTDGSAEGSWHLATKEELQGIGTDPPTTWLGGMPSVTWTMPGTPFVGVGDIYWSSTENSTSTACFMWMTDGDTVCMFDKDAGTLFVWPVQDTCDSV